MPTEPQQENLNEAITRGYEFSDIRVRRIFLSGLILSIAVPVIGFFVFVHLRILAGPSFLGLTRPTIAVRWFEPIAAYPLPRLLVAPGRQLNRLRAQEEQELSSYGWLNQTQGVVRIPIERAMKLTLKRGLPARQPGVTNLDSSEYELIIQRRLEHEKELKQRQAPGAAKKGGTGP